MSLQPFRHFPAWMRLAAFVLAAGLLALLRTSSTEEAPAPRKPLQLDISTVDWSKEELERSPNVIVVLSEAFWDPTLIEGLTFSKDPIPTYHALKEKYTSGWMLSPQFGGGTANVELEVLTGNSMRFLPEGSIAYEEFIKRDVDSLATIMARQGYTATAISPFYNWYFDSRNVYRHLGFSRFISFEYFNPNEYVGPYIGDHAVAKRIIEESERSEGPDFIFANTMENHYHYWSNKFKRNTIEIKDTRGTMSGEALSILETYAQGASGADNMLHELVDHYSKVKEPTIIVFFGDHLPFLEDNYFVYRESGYIEGENDPNFLEKMYSVPVVVWNNYKPDAKDTLHFSPSFLSPYVLQQAKLQGSGYTEYLSRLSKQIPIIPPKAYYKEMNINEEDLAEYKARQDQILFGDLGEEQSGAPASTYIVGYGDPVITSVTPDKITLGDGIVNDLKKSATVTVKGGRFGIASTIYANGTALPTTWISEEVITAAIPKELVENSSAVELQVRVVDEKETVLGQSQPYPLPIVSKKP
ncbi:sulfatase-like hydrolase/transferase [Paenibacillus sp. OAS669]|uniref:sulfatase-like hydrolase/transferase n=1 Tax=Paenibacillus sp. OAS669 TaxID=2663821 RepID=UPI001A0A655C|nr:sulfatase-like hydrolase/transferase [Paenibacillus sp. OAS669]MBE1443422.1 phosphoglycerol transferase MdoB-like AlkP superfamily enzyme [Paenibacillus sp. OAS669]